MIPFSSFSDHTRLSVKTRGTLSTTTPVARAADNPVSPSVSTFAAETFPGVSRAIPRSAPPTRQRPEIVEGQWPGSHEPPGEWERFARYEATPAATKPSLAAEGYSPGEAREAYGDRPSLHARREAGNPHLRDDTEKKSRYLPLSRTTDKVLRILLDGDLSRVRAESVAETLGISCTTLRRRLRNDHTSYQFLLDRARQYRCEARLRERWLPGKCLADELGYLEVNSFYRAFRRWTGLSYSDYRQRYH
ncbi:helix-turn-helix domain-containing protein [Congregibacter litoralis]|uniref:AraC-type DNA-binding protein domain protein-containing protein n=1 Tax=Congregibacter litoralis KT71 TaxID=314285 RepID=A4A6J8_9GAMM|nr:AraC family transcriptional regulator [Congregibacter litoralis]EAQ98645.2 AraC-type DNA-binding protein domain protein-containing protein [Congregibacter litoralis KT71]